MQRYSTKHDGDLRLGASPGLSTDDSPSGGSVREWLAVLNERFHHLAADVRDLAGRMSLAEENMADVRRRLAVIEERLSHTATKSWILGCGIAFLVTMLTGTLGGIWWMFQQFIGPLLRASAG